MAHTEIPSYVYTGDVNIVDSGGKWIGITRDTCGEIIEVIGASDLDDGDENGAIITSGSIYVRGHVEMRQAIESCGWDIRSIADRDQRRAMMMDAYHDYYGADVHEDFGGRFEIRVTTDAEAINQANRWAR